MSAIPLSQIAPWHLPDVLEMYNKRRQFLASVDNPRQLQALQRAIDLSRQMLFSPLSVDIILASLSAPPEALIKWEDEMPSPKEWRSIAVDRSIRGRMLDFLQTTPINFALIADDSAHACWIKSTPDLIYINNNLFFRLGLSQDFEVNQPEIFAFHVFFVAASICHEVVHLLRGQILGLSSNTPPSLSSGWDDRWNTILPSEGKVSFGQGGNFYEVAYFGGILTPEVYSIDDPQCIFSKQIRSVKLFRCIGEKQEEQEISLTVIRYVLNESPGWQHRFPIVFPKFKTKAASPLHHPHMQTTITSDSISQPAPEPLQHTTLAHQTIAQIVNKNDKREDFDE